MRFLFNSAKMQTEGEGVGGRGGLAFPRNERGEVSIWERHRSRGEMICKNGGKCVGGVYVLDGERGSFFVENFGSRARFFVWDFRGGKAFRTNSNRFMCYIICFCRSFDVYIVWFVFVCTFYHNIVVEEYANLYVRLVTCVNLNINSCC